MIFNVHSRLKDKHAFLSPSKYHWINYGEDKLDRAYVAHLAAQRGTELHAFAHEAIRLGVRLPRTSTTLSMYVNDGIGFRMTPELALYYSDNAFGHADCLSFRKNKLRVHDLKTGTTPTSFDQLKVYAALFCLEYKFRPSEIEMELRIYQNDEAKILEPDPDDVFKIMDRIIMFDKRIEAIKEETML